MNDKKILEEFSALREHGKRSNTARLRTLYDEVERLRKMGISRQAIFEVLHTNGLEFNSLDTFARTFYRIKQERSKDISKRVTPAVEVKQTNQHQFQTEEARKPNREATVIQKKVSTEVNPLHQLSPKDGDMNEVPKKKFEADEN